MDGVQLFLSERAELLVSVAWALFLVVIVADSTIGLTIIISDSYGDPQMVWPVHATIVRLLKVATVLALAVAIGASISVATSHRALSGQPSNIVEQLNQTFTIMVTLRAIEVLLRLRPEAGGFRVALGTSSGRDIESMEVNLVAAETFAATKPSSNQKLKKEQDRLARDKARHRYIFFASPDFTPGRHPELETDPNVQVYAVDL